MRTPMVDGVRIGAHYNTTFIFVLTFPIVTGSKMVFHIQTQEGYGIAIKPIQIN